MNVTTNQIHSALKKAGERLPRTVQALGDHCKSIVALKDKERSLDEEIVKALQNAQCAASDGDYQGTEAHLAAAGRLRAARAALPHQIEEAAAGAPKVMSPIVDAINAAIVLAPLLEAVTKEFAQMDVEMVRRITAACPQINFIPR